MNELEQLTTQIKDTFEGLVNSVVHLQEYKTTARIHHSTLELIVGRIAEQEVDVIVNATNTALSGGRSDVDSAIHQAAGPQLAAASRTLAPCRAGDAVLTPGFRLPTPWVIHTVGPMYTGGQQDEATVLDKAYRNSMRLAVQSGLIQIAFPSISTGTGADEYPVDEAAQIALGAVLEFIDGYRNSDLLIRFVLHTRADFAVYDRVLKEFAEPPKALATDRDDISHDDVSHDDISHDDISHSESSHSTIAQGEDAEVSSSGANPNVEAELEDRAVLANEQEQEENQTLAADTEARSAWNSAQDEEESETPVADAENATADYAAWGHERERFLSIDMETEADISLAITETDIEEAELESANIESIEIGLADIEVQKETDISIDSESIADTLLFSEIEPVILVNSAQRERYVAQDDIQLVSAREELESALNQLKSAQDEFRSIQEIESVLRFTEDQPDNQLIQDDLARGEPLAGNSSPTSSDNDRLTETEGEPAIDKPVEEDAVEEDAPEEDAPSISMKHEQSAQDEEVETASPKEELSE